MFTGLVESIGVLRRKGGGAVARALIEARLGPLALGESVSVNGACLTVDRIATDGFECDLSPETLALTTLGALPHGARVHLERATPLGGRMGGHMVLGHVDGIGRVSARTPAGPAIRLRVQAPTELARFMAAKGSIAIDGVSLTLNQVSPPGGAAVELEVMLVPHTIERTLLGELRPGAAVNLEADVLARYVARQMEAASIGGAEGRGEAEAHVDHDQRFLEKLRAGGFR
ncbi:MAG: riboflavin synthase [Polyangiaceae bacterium]|nr:riboflavin synthase [Polyangiaceae bacterium]